MNEAVKKGLGFGVTSAIITTLGLIVGIHSGTDLRGAVIGAILVIAFADSLADSLGIYFSERSQQNSKKSEPFIAMLTAFGGKFIFALTFIIPILVFSSLHTAIITDLLYGLILLTIFSYFSAKSKKENAFSTIVFYVLLASVVITASHFIGAWVSSIT